MENQKGVQNYLKYMISQFWKLRIEETASGWRVKTIWFKSLEKSIQSKITRMAQRRVTNREVVITVKNTKTGNCLYIPNEEFKNMVRKEDGLKFTNVIVTIGNNDNFIVERNKSSNVQTVKNPELYHTTKSNLVNKMSELDPAFSRNAGDFGKGIYLSPSKDFALLYAQALDCKNNPNIHIISGAWYNNDLINLLLQIKASSNSTMNKVLIGKDGSPYKVKVFCNGGKEWIEAILNGWSGITVPDCSIVIGPVTPEKATGLIRKLSKRYILAKGRKNLKNVEKIIDEATSKVKARRVPENTNEILYQVCIYNKKVLNHINWT